MTLKLVTRAEAGLRPPRSRSSANMNGPITAHWNGPPVKINGSLTWDHSKCAGIVRGIQAFHMDGRGWVDIAYNFLECPHGYTFEGRGLNIVNAANGVTSANRSSHTICCMAGTGNPHPMEEKIGFRAAVRYISDKTDAQDRAIGHRDHKSTDCPGNDRYAWVHAGMPTSGATPPPPPPPVPQEEEDMVPATVRASTGKNWVYVVGDDRAAYEIGRNGWRKVGGLWTSGLAAIIRDDDEVTLFGRGDDKVTYWRMILNPDGSIKQSDPLAGRWTSGPSVVLRDDGGIDIFGRGTDRKLYTVSIGPGGSHEGQPVSLGGLIWPKAA